MELENFIHHTITNIVSAISRLEKDLTRDIKLAKMAGVNTSNIDFDLAVTAEETSSKEGGITVLSVVKGGINSESKNTMASRLTFSIYVGYPREV